MEKNKVLVVDLDGTVFRWHLIFQWLRFLAKKYPQVRELRKQTAPELKAYRTRKGSFDAYVEKVTRLFWDEGRYVGISEANSIWAAQEVVRESGEHVYVFMRELIAAAREEGDWALIAISGSPEHVVGAFAELLGLDFALGTVHPVDAQGLFTAGQVTTPVHDKGAALRALLAKNGGHIDLSQSVVVGDTLSDASMMTGAGYPICFNPSKGLAALAKRERWGVVIERKDLIVIPCRNDPGLQTEAPTLANVLPMDLADALQKRLPSGMIF